MAGQLDLDQGFSKFFALRPHFEKGLFYVTPINTLRARVRLIRSLKSA